MRRSDKRRRLAGDGQDPATGVRVRARRLGLQTRVTLSFGASALLLCVALSSITYLTARTALINQAENSIETQAYSNATATEDYLEEGFSPTDILNFITQASLGAPSESLLYLAGSGTKSGWINSNTNVRERDIPQGLRSDTLSSTVAYAQVVAINGSPQLVIGVPIVEKTKAYFGIFSLAQVMRTLRILLLSLALAVLLTTLAGAILGRWLSRRALRPLREVSEVALAIASGEIDTRLDVGDVRDLTVIADSFNQMVDRLQARIERDAQFTSDVSHELRSPLTTLATSLSVIESRRDELPERSVQALDLLSAEIRHFQQMVEDLLEISRLDAGVGDFQPSLVAAGELVRQAVRSWGEPVRVVVRADVNRQLVSVDKRRFERVIANLLDNAKRYAGGATRVLVERHDAMMRILVEDRGPGIAEDERERIFERFARGGQTAGQRGTTVGTGLGLALVVEHIKLHDGNVYVQNRPGGGACFVVELPLAEERLEDGEELAEDRPSDWSESAGDAPSAPPSAEPDDMSTPRTPVRTGDLQP
jgi:two-component system, OmpR family, sensor histidine kinase MtrB